MKIQLQTMGEYPFLVLLSPKLHRSILFKKYTSGRVTCWTPTIRKFPLSFTDLSMKIQLQNMAKKPFLDLLSPKLHRSKLETVSDSSQTSLPRTPYKFPESQGEHFSRIPSFCALLLLSLSSYICRLFGMAMP